MWKPLRRTRDDSPAGTHLDIVLAEASDRACAELAEEIAARSARVAGLLAGGRRVDACTVDAERGSMTITCDGDRIVCAARNADVAVQVAAMVHLEPTTVRPGRADDGGLLLAFYSPTWAYALVVVPALD